MVSFRTLGVRNFENLELQETWDVRMYSPKMGEAWSYVVVPQEFGNLGLRRTCSQKIKGTFNVEAPNVELP
jgi:hypothetical protein